MNTCNTSSCGCGPAAQTSASQPHVQSQTQPQPHAQPGPGAAHPTAVFHPRCDVFQTADHFVIAADMPGCKPEEIDVQFDRGVLTLRGRVRPRTPEGVRDGDVLLDEYEVGDYYRSFRVAAPIDSTRIGAEYRQGVLTVRLPKHEAARSRRIPVNAPVGA